MSTKPGTRRDLRRRIDQFVANPRCDANVRAVVHDVSMRDVARRDLPADHPSLREGQSPFALARGVQFEKALYAPPTRILEALVKAGVLPARHGEVLDLRLRAHGGALPTLDAAATAFNSVLRGLAKTSPDVEADEVPAVILAPAMRLDGAPLLPHGMFAADLIAVRLSEHAPRVRLHVGEVKVYPDRGGHTDRTQLASARAQAGLYVHALRRTIDALALGASVQVEDAGFLVLAKPSSNLPSVRWPEDLRWQARRAEDWWARLASVATQVLAEGVVADDEAKVAAVCAAETAYEEGCVSFCPRAPVCRQKALAAGDAAVLGADVASLVGNVSLIRAEALLRGVAKPVTSAEKALLARVDVVDSVMEVCR
jgi:hypothetical protein